MCLTNLVSIAFIHIQGSGLWKANNKDACYTVYLTACEDILRHAYFKTQQPVLVAPVTAAVKEAKDIKGTTS